MVPTLFQRLRAIRWLNEAAFSVALATGVGVAFANIADVSLAVASFAATLVLGPFWARLLRRFPIAFSKSVAPGRLIAIAMAIANASLAGSLMVTLNRGSPSDNFGNAFVGAVLGATFGAIFWIPTLVVTCVLFALPTAWASSLAKRGLAGEERGEWLVGMMCGAVSIATYLATFRINTQSHIYDFGHDWFLPVFRLSAVASFLLAALAAFASWKRDLARKSFVAQAKEGKIAGYRVQDTVRGEVLMRVAASANAYRAMDLCDEVFAVDEDLTMNAR